MSEINYKSIAPFYDIAASEKEDAKLWKGLIKEIKHQKNQPLIIYELGIGTGRVLEQLLDELTPEDKYIGIDISKELCNDPLQGRHILAHFKVDVIKQPPDNTGC